MTTAAEQHQLEMFAGRHRGWRVVNVSSWELQAGTTRVVHEDRVGDVTWELRLRVDPRKPLSRDCWIGSYTSPDGAGDTYQGTYDEIAEVMSRVDRCFALLGELRSCRSRTAARDFVVEFVPREIKIMQKILDIRMPGSWASALEAVIIRVCGHHFRIRVDQWRLTHNV